MDSEYYFSKDVNEHTWEIFTELEHAGSLSDNYRKITGYGWKDKFAFNNNGDAIYINDNGKKFKGVWFQVNHRRIAVFNYSE